MIGALLFIGGWIVPFLINLVLAFLKLGFTVRFNGLVYLSYAGVFLSVCVGLPLIIVSILLSRRPGGRRRA